MGYLWLPVRTPLPAAVLSLLREHSSHKHAAPEHTAHKLAAGLQSEHLEQVVEALGVNVTAHCQLSRAASSDSHTDRVPFPGPGPSQSPSTPHCQNLAWSFPAAPVPLAQAVRGRCLLGRCLPALGFPFSQQQALMVFLPGASHSLKHSLCPLSLVVAVVFNKHGELRWDKVAGSSSP